MVEGDAIIKFNYNINQMKSLHLMDTVMYNVKNFSMKSPSILEFMPTQGHGVFSGCLNQKFQGGGWNKTAIGLWTH